MPSRRTLIALMAASLAASGLLAACDRAPTPVAGDEEMFLGKADAPITLIEYASVACSHCANWNNDVLPQFKAKYIDTGQVKLVTREFHAGDPTFSAAGFLLARCAGKDKYFEVTDAIYEQQQEIASSGDLIGGLERIGREVAGLTPQQVRACLTDPEMVDAQNKRIDRYIREHNIDGTPTFVIGNEVVGSGFIDMAGMDAIIASAKAKAQGGTPS